MSTEIEQGTNSLPSDDQYALVAAVVQEIPAPTVDYLPPAPADSEIRIALIGCGGIASTHLATYKEAGWTVVALCDIDAARAAQRRDQFYPNATVTTDPEAIFQLKGIHAIDITTHTRHRPPLVRRALECGHNVLSQKPFVTDITTGKELVALADTTGGCLAVNQNGRFAPHFSYIREMVSAGHLGDITSIHTNIQWDHTWIKGTPFAKMRDIVLYDFAIHWFDFMSSVIPKDATLAVVAKRSAARLDLNLPPLEASVIITWSGGQATMAFNAGCVYGSGDETTIVGTRGSIRSTGPDSGSQSMTVNLPDGKAVPMLQGKWFNDGFRGTMGELLSAVEQKREPRNSAAGNLRSLMLCFAAIESANTGGSVCVGDITRLPSGSIPDHV